MSLARLPLPSESNRSAESCLRAVTRPCTVIVTCSSKICHHIDFSENDPGADSLRSSPELRKKKRMRDKERGEGEKMGRETSLSTRAKCSRQTRQSGGRPPRAALEKDRVLTRWRAPLPTCGDGFAFSCGEERTLSRRGVTRCLRGLLGFRRHTELRQWGDVADVTKLPAAWSFRHNILKISSG